MSNTGLLTCFEKSHKSTAQVVKDYEIKQDVRRGLDPLSPKHYDNSWKVGDFITEMNLTFYEGNVVKYLCRHRKKDGLADLIKARNYLNKVINEYDTSGT
jgi:hypothetical protein